MKTFPIDLYGINIHFIVNKRDAAKVYKAVSGRTLDTDAAGQMWKYENGFYVCVYDDGPDCIDTLAHEISHCVIRICKYIGYNPGDEDEPFAFLTGYITKTLMFAHPKFKEALNGSGRT